MKRFVIITRSYLDTETMQLSIGGVQTYMDDLAKLAGSNGYEVHVCQLIDKKNMPHELLRDNVHVCLMPTGRHYLQSANQVAFNRIYRRYNSQETIFLIATDQMDIRSKANNVIQIQHGVAFDIPGDMMMGSVWHKTKTLQRVNKTIRCLRNVKRASNTPHLVCVDYNYYNWFRTLSTFNPADKAVVIPNYASQCITRENLMRKLENRSLIKIVFARRFVSYRGTQMFADVIKEILCKFSNVDVTFAGSGPLRGYIENMFSDEQRVHITSYEAKDSIAFHSAFDIAVVPTIYSEGTSLSLCEAMAAGCYPIATHVGGMTNMIIDGYNGRLVAPTEVALYEALSTAITMTQSEFNQIVTNAYETAVSAFSKEVWQRRWMFYLKSVEQNLLTKK